MKQRVAILPAFVRGPQCTVLVLVVLVSIAQSVFCQIPANRLANWQGNVGVEGGIPTRTRIFQTLNPGATVAQINAAIANCPTEQVVFLSAGTYNLTGTINLTKSNVTLRGAGATQTRLVFIDEPDSSINMSGSGMYNPFPITNWTAGYAQGTTQLTVASTAGFSVGNLVALDQQNDSNYIGLGQEGATGLGNDPSRGHLQMQLTEITAINRDRVTINPGVFMRNWSATFSPRMMVYSQTKLQNTGIEDMHMEGPIRGVHNDGTPCGEPCNPSICETACANTGYKVLLMAYAQNCWLKNVDMARGEWAEVEVDESKRIEIRDSYFHEGVSAGQSRRYSVLLVLTTQLLVENNIFHGSATIGVSPMLVGNGTSGSVVGYNLFEHVQTLNNGNWMGYTVANHNAHPHFNLYEGNITPQIAADYIHGSSSDITVFRNVVRGRDWIDAPSPPATTSPQDNSNAIHVQMYNRYFNIVGNILGTPGWNDHYEQYGQPVTQWFEKGIYRLGYKAVYDQTSDALVPSTMIRHGNWDNVTNAIVWGSDITTHSLPNSYYLAGKPSWFGNLAWPPFSAANPTATQTKRIPAGYRFVNGVNPPTETTSLANTSSRALVPLQSSHNTLIGGFIISGTQNKRVLLRATGPSLSLSGKVMDPVLELHDSRGALIASNDNWVEASNRQDIANTGIPPTDTRESAILTSLAPGPYTAIVRGVDGTTGVALVEIFALD
jgi:hypothetical protein